ncbi:MAG: hypothetical protein ABSA26_00610, partial [Thermoguttaceae bacterium]
MSISSIISALSSYSSESQSQSTKTLFDQIKNQSIVSSLLSDSNTTDSNSNSTNDILDLSNEAQSSADQFYTLMESLSQRKIQITVDKAGSSVQGKLSEALSAAGIDTTKEIDLQLDSKGNVVVSNNNSDA